ncbi:MAG: hypothetical protein KBS86_01010 [Proteobacteria bacterium]|nr:hypothetical protein [Candidatus Enterousia scatequi]
MNKYIFVLLGLLVCASSYGTTSMCKRSNTAIIVLSKSTNGTSATSNTSSKTWTVKFNYTTMTGSASCNEISGTANTANTALFSTASDVGPQCWCRMDTPAVSYWTYLRSYSGASDCASGCTSACADAAKTSTAFRTGMFESIW